MGRIRWDAIGGMDGDRANTSIKETAVSGADPQTAYRNRPPRHRKARSSFLRECRTCPMATYAERKKKAYEEQRAWEAEQRRQQGWYVDRDGQRWVKLPNSDAYVRDNSTEDITKNWWHGHWQPPVSAQQPSVSEPPTTTPPAAEPSLAPLPEGVILVDIEPAPALCSTTRANNLASHHCFVVCCCFCCFVVVVFLFLFVVLLIVLLLAQSSPRGPSWEKLVLAIRSRPTVFLQS